MLVVGPDTAKKALPVPPFPAGSMPVTASVSARSRAPQTYVDAPVTLRVWPTVDESDIAVYGLPPLP